MKHYTPNRCLYVKVAKLITTAGSAEVSHIKNAVTKIFKEHRRYFTIKKTKSKKKQKTTTKIYKKKKNYRVGGWGWGWAGVV